MPSVKIKMKQDRIDKIKDICKKFNNKGGELINVLHQTQDYIGYLPAEAQELIAKELNVSVAHVYGVVSFYSFFTMTPKGEHPVSVCMGTACYVRGAEKVLDEFKRILNINVGETTPDGKFSLTALRCIGACGLAPVITIGEEVHGRLSTDEIQGIVEKYKG
jgi:NADH-quinone oxidoreductase subunit E/NADP-reducing hydrogenase subunit HndA